MKTKLLKISTPCSENWEKMTASEKGNYCVVCSKTVVDFTKLSLLEISTQMQKNNGKLCARVTQSQLKMPLINLDNSIEYKIPYSNVAAGLMLATTMIASGQPSQTENLLVKTEVSQSQRNTIEEEKPHNQKPSLSKPESFTIFKGKVNYRNETAVNNAKITFVTALRQFTAYSLKDGSFAMKIPSDLIDDANVIRVSYDDIIKTAKKNPNYDEYGSREDYILSKAEVNSNYKIVAELIIMAAGGISISSQNEGSPMIIHQGKEILFSDFEKARIGKKSSCSLENKEYSYFDSEAAIAIYGTKARWGLYILNDKIEK